MKKGINLAFGTKKVDKVFRKAFVVSVIFFVVVVVVSISLIVYRLILKSTFDNLEVQEQQLNQQLLALVEKRDKFLEIKTRLKDIQNIINRRSPTTVRIDTVTGFIPTTATIDTLSGDEETISVSIESDDLASLNDLVQQKLIEVSEDRQKGIKKIDMSSFGLNPKSLLYEASFIISFK